MGEVNIPALRICLTSKCNFECLFCKPGGESGCQTADLLSAKTIERIVQIALKTGIRHIKLTGGEVLLRDDILEILTRIQRCEPQTIELITNGYLLSYYVDALEFKALDTLTVSLHTLKENTFHFLSGQHGIDRVLTGILQAVAFGLPLRINTIIMRCNRGEFWNLVDFAERVRAELKLHELLHFRVERDSFWLENYVTLNDIKKELMLASTERQIVWPEGMLGAPMVRYSLKNDSRVLVWDSSSGSHYGDICESCRLYPCQDGLHSLRVTSDGKLKRCWGRNNPDLDILTPVRKGKDKVAIEMFNQALRTFATCVYKRTGWSNDLKQAIIMQKRGRTEKIKTESMLSAQSTF